VRWCRLVRYVHLWIYVTSRASRSIESVKVYRDIPLCGRVGFNGQHIGTKDILESWTRGCAGDRSSTMAMLEGLYWDSFEDGVHSSVRELILIPFELATSTSQYGGG
jgi:hypothetical protein